MNYKVECRNAYTINWKSQVCTFESNCVAFINELRSRETLRDNEPQKGLLDSLDDSIERVRQGKDSSDEAEKLLEDKVKGKLIKSNRMHGIVNRILCT